MTLTVAAAATLTVVVLTLLWLTMAITSTNLFYNERSILLTKLASRNIEYGLTLPEQVTRRVQEQMVVSALLTAELVSVAEKRVPMAPKEIAALLKQVIEHSKEGHDYPLVDEFVVTDEKGHVYIRTGEKPATSPSDSEKASFPAAFEKLLEPGAAPVLQPLQPPVTDGERRLAVGVSGVDKPRIVQLGAGEALIQSIQSDFTTQNLLQQFISRAGKKDADTVARPPAMKGGLAPDKIDTDVTRIVIVQADGRVDAAVGRDQTFGGNIADEEVVTFCQAFLKDPREGVAVHEFGKELGVATLLRNRGDDKPRALFMQHRLDVYEKVLSRRVNFTIITGAVMVVLSVLMSLWVARRLSSPILELCQAARRLGQGDLDQRIAMKADKEFQIMADSFNQMADSLQAQMQELKEETKRRERLESELLIAAQLQRSLLPEEMPRVDRLALAAWNRAAREVGGDFYDFVTLDEHLLGIAVGDATDKGLPAAMLSTECWSVFRALATAEISPPELLHRTNNALYKRVGSTGRFVTMFYMTVDTKLGTVRYSVAGHNPPLLVGTNPGRVIRLTSDHGLPLGITENCVFEEKSLRLEPSDTMLLYSDGIVEAQSPTGELYTEARLRELLIQHRHDPLPELLAALWSDIEAHMDCEEVADDMTVVAVRFGG